MTNFEYDDLVYKLKTRDNEYKIKCLFVVLALTSLVTAITYEFTPDYLNPEWICLFFLSSLSIGGFIINPWRYRYKKLKDCYKENTTHHLALQYLKLEPKYKN
ncbi:MAG: hypothetical protein WCG25_04535 [bacterium]